MKGRDVSKACEGLVHSGQVVGGGGWQGVFDCTGTLTA